MSEKRKRKCLYLANFDPTVSSTGTTTRGRLFLRRICRHFDTHLVHFEGSSSEGRDESLISRLRKVDSIPYTDLGFFLFSHSFLRAGAKALKRDSFEFIFADCEKAGFYGYLLARKYKIPFVYNSHNVEFERYISMARTNILRYLFVPYIYALERLACTTADLTVAISQSDADKFGRWVPRPRMLVLPCAFDETQINPFQEEQIPARPVILMVGNYAYGANRESARAIVSEILPRVVERHPEVVFRFVGREFPPDVQHPNVDAIGFVDDLNAEYTRATMIIAPIDIGGGVKIKVVEGLATGKHLITTRKGMEGIDYTGLENVVVTSREEFARHIVDALDRKPVRTLSNWEFVSSRFGTKTSLDTLLMRVNLMTNAGSET